MRTLAQNRKMGPAVQIFIAEEQINTVEAGERDSYQSRHSKTQSAIVLATGRAL